MDLKSMRSMKNPSAMGCASLCRWGLHLLTFPSQYPQKVQKVVGHTNHWNLFESADMKNQDALTVSVIYHFIWQRSHKWKMPLEELSGEKSFGTRRYRWTPAWGQMSRVLNDCTPSTWLQEGDPQSRRRPRPVLFDFLQLKNRTLDPVYSNLFAQEMFCTIIRASDAPTVQSLNILSWQIILKTEKCSKSLKGAETRKTTWFIFCQLMSLSGIFHLIKNFVKLFALLKPLVGNQIIDLTGDIPLIKPNGRIWFVAYGSVKFTTQGQQPRTTANKKKIQQ